jgi:hypothetical protein
MSILKTFREHITGHDWELSGLAQNCGERGEEFSQKQDFLMESQRYAKAGPLSFSARRCR